MEPDNETTSVVDIVTLPGQAAKSWEATNVPARIVG